MNIIVSLTSHTKERLKYVGQNLYLSFLKNNINVKIVLTLYKDDIKFIPNDLQELIDNKIVELIIADKNLGSHLKYFYCMKKYRNASIITIDDDSVYPKEMIPDFIKNLKIHPNTILCRCARIINPNVSYQHWFDCVSGLIKVKWHGCKNEIRQDLSPLGYAGICYPANILNVNDDMIIDINKTLHADDIFLSVIEQKKKINIMLVGYNYNKLDKSEKGFDAISSKINKNSHTEYIDNYLKEKGIIK